MDLGMRLSAGKFELILDFGIYYLLCALSREYLEAELFQ